MTDALTHRGPDEGAVRLLGAGALIGRAAAALGHRRLKVIDLSSAAAQPMRDAQDTGCLVYNGELYNTAALLARAARRRTHLPLAIPTPMVVLQALLHWGPEDALSRFKRHVRPRLLGQPREPARPGARPLRREAALLRRERGAAAVRVGDRCTPAHGGVNTEIDPEAVELYLTFGWIPAPWTIYRGVRKLPHAASLSADTEGRTRLRRYYRLEERLQAQRPVPRTRRCARPSRRP
jgi:asparagine synthase (glutamine-hydrolysing)